MAYISSSGPWLVIEVSEPTNPRDCRDGFCEGCNSWTCITCHGPAVGHPMYVLWEHEVW